MPEKSVLEDIKSQESAILPTWLYPACFWAALPVLLLSLLAPHWSKLGVWYMLAVPAVTALVVVVTQWKRDRQVSLAALMALLGLVIVVIARQFIHTR